MPWSLGPALVLGARTSLTWVTHTTLFGLSHRVGLLASVTLNANPNDLPGGNVLQSLTDGIGGWALIAALVGLLIGAASWALGSHTQNYQQSMFGKRAVLVSSLAALLIGAAPHLINFFFNSGLHVGN